MKNKHNKKTKKTISVKDSELFVNAVSADNNVKAKKILSKIVQNKCKQRFKKILTDIKEDK